MNRIVLHIDRLMLSGVDRAEAGAVAAAMQVALRAELQAQLAAPGGPAKLAMLTAQRSTPTLRAGRGAVKPGTHAAGAGDGGADGIGDGGGTGGALGRAVATQLIHGGKA